MSRFLRALARLQASRAPLFVALALLLTVGSVPWLLKLGLNGDLVALLPESMPSVRDLGEITRRFGAPQTFTLLVTSSDPAANRRFLTDLVAQVQTIDECVLSVDWNVREYGDFVRRNLFLFADADELAEIRDSLRARIDEGVAKANPFYIDLDDAPAKPADLEEEIAKVRKHHGVDAQREKRLGDGFFSHPDDRSVAAFVRTSIRGGEPQRVEQLMHKVDAAVAKLNPKKYAPDLYVDYGGGIMDMYAEQHALEDAAILATLITLVLVAGVILIFFRRLRAIPILFIGLVPPMALTFAFAQWAVHYLNASSAFLSAIVIGNGVNPHIIWLARYFESRDGGQTADESVVEAHLHTWPGTLSASLAAAVAYASLCLTDFRAFRDFGVIGGVGMTLCWLATFLWTPVVAQLFERFRPSRSAPAQGGTSLIRLFERAALGAPRGTLLVGGVVTVVCLVGIGRWVAAGPIEYDFRKLQSQNSDAPLQLINRRIADCVDEATNGSAIALLARSPADAVGIVKQLEEVRKKDPTALGAVRSVYDLLPHDQERKLPLVRELRKLMLKVRPRVDAAKQAEIDKYLPADDLHVVGPDDLPLTVARPFIEKDGRRGSIVYVEHNLTQNQFDGRYLVRWSNAARSPTNADGSRVAVAGAAPVMADLVQAILRDGPKAVAASFLATLTLLLFTFLRARDRVFTFASHLLGVVWMVGGMALLRIKVNFLNFVALPVTFGLGVDYGVNVMRRLVEEEERVGVREGVVRALRHTGGAVTLCSMTTLIGYISLYTSPNKAVNSFGAAMSLGEVTCLVAAVVVLPAALMLLYGGPKDERRSPPAGR